MPHTRSVVLFLCWAAPFCAGAQTFSGSYEIVNANSGILLDDPGWSASNGTVMDQWAGNSGANQRWVISSVGNGQYEISNLYDGLALEVSGQSASNGASVDQWSYWGGANQRWTISALGNGNYAIFNVNSGLPLEVYGLSLADGGSIDQWQWWGGANQQWMIVPTTVSGTVTPASAGTGAPAASFHGFNWADPGDNYQDGPLLLSGLSVNNDRPTVQTIAGTVVGAFQRVGANAVRIPINPATALGTWWSSYRGVIDKATALGMKVLVTNWTGSGHGGTIDDLPSAFRMWDTVVTTYNGNPNVYFEILNEPYGYGTSDWLNVVSTWLQRYPTVPRGRVFVGGTGYCQYIPSVASSSVCAGCLFSVHDYGFWNEGDASRSDWYQSLSYEVGSYSSHTVLTEFGAVMNEGWNYLGPDNGNNGVASLNGFCDYCHDNIMGSLYWPGLRDGDWYSMFIRNNSTTSLSLTNPSGMSLVQYGWRYRQIGSSSNSYVP
jgi:hypothetical protein